MRAFLQITPDPDNVWLFINVVINADNLKAKKPQDLRHIQSVSSLKLQKCFSSQLNIAASCYVPYEQWNSFN